MSKKPYTLTYLYSLLLIIAGLIGFIARYIESGDLQFTAMIPAFFGLLILALSPGLKKENKTIAHIIVILTGLLGFMVSFMLIKGYVNETMNLSRKAYIFFVVALASWYTLGNYIKGFIDRKKSNKEQL